MVQLPGYTSLLLHPVSLTCNAERHIICTIIQSVRCQDTERLFTTGKAPARFAAIVRVAERKLAQLDAAMTLAFLVSPPGNRLEALRGDRAGQHSIRVNDRWRVCFTWTEQGPADVEIVDYH